MMELAGARTSSGSRALAIALTIGAAIPGSFGCHVSSVRPIQPIERVLIISVDGMRPDLLMRANAPVMQSVLHRSSYTLHARTVDEGYTVPSHVSMLTGVV